ncbi:luciferase family protein [Agarivorans sp. Alg241-V36]|uniref:luciferase domain-containing protein n=1 Tax=Agarivorans sp. Alg241-V36 TaxID=2305992 RepID=UPI0013D85D18|nr:luciferase family protein [Agarivorans sp. Alg241-V36]
MLVEQSKLKQALYNWLVSQTGVNSVFYPNDKGGFYGFSYKDREFAHFHQADELDLKLGKKTIARLGLQHPNNSLVHPKRSAGSAWIELPFHHAADLETIKGLVKLAISQL